MTCDEMNMLLADYWGDSLTAAQEMEFEAHMRTCEPCHAQFARLDGLWRTLPTVPGEQPSDEMRIRFYETLGAYRQGLESTQQPKDRWRWWPVQSRVWQAAIAAGLLIVGVGAGYGSRPESAKQEISQLREEVAGMRQMVALSLLQQQSASERLRGVSWAYRAEPGNNEILSALVSAVNNDANVNVRLAAVDALHAFASSPITREGTREAVMASLPHQETPLVQVALIDLLVDMKERQASPELRRLASDETVNDGVKQRALWALSLLEQ